MAEPNWDSLFSGVSNLGGLLGGGFLTAESFDRLGEIGDTAYTRGGEIGAQAQSDAAFEGYGVTGPNGGSTAVDASGNTQFNLSGNELALQNQILGGAGDLFGQATNMNSGPNAYATSNMGRLAGMMQGYQDQATGSIEQRQNDIYGQMQAAMQPDQQRAQLGMENRQRAQGRLGMSTGMYGGTGEQFALDRAQAEANNSAFYQARGQALGEQQQGANLLFSNMGTQLAQGQGMAQNQAILTQAGRGMMGSAYAPQAAQIDRFNAGSQAFGYEDVGRRQGANLFAEGSSAGLNAYLGANLGQADLLGTLGGSLLSGASGGLFGGLSDLGDFFGSLGG